VDDVFHSHRIEVEAIGYVRYLPGRHGRRVAPRPVDPVRRRTVGQGGEIRDLYPVTARDRSQNRKARLRTGAALACDTYGSSRSLDDMPNRSSATGPPQLLGRPSDVRDRSTLSDLRRMTRDPESEASSDPSVHEDRARGFRPADDIVDLSDPPNPGGEPWPTRSPF
jgi:hypothetical protein